MTSIRPPLQQNRSNYKLINYIDRHNTQLEGEKKGGEVGGERSIYNEIHFTRKLAWNAQMSDWSYIQFTYR